MAELNVSQEIPLSKPELEKKLMSMVQRMDRESVEYLVRTAEREVIWLKRGEQ